ncbi:phage tail family protein [Mammaliicoccus sciuri]
MTIIQRLNGQMYDLDKLGIRTVDFIVDSPSYQHLTEEIEGRGLLDLGSTLLSREINCIFRIIAKDSADFALWRDEIFWMFRSSEAFYLIDKKNRHKRWLVKVRDPYNIPQRGVFGKFQVSFIVHSGLAESVGTTLDPLTFTAEKWQVGQGLVLDEPKYAHEETTFSIFNAGDVVIDPRQFPLKIIYRGASNNLQIRNNTTGDVWTYNGSSGASDQLILDGVRSLKNGASIFRDTNKKLISIVPGWNDFTLSGTSGSFLISFEHRFYYY